MLIVPIGVYVTIALIPADVWQECEASAARAGISKLVKVREAHTNIQPKHLPMLCGTCERPVAFERQTRVARLSPARVHGRGLRRQS